MKYPKEITYGTNMKTDRGLSCQISFGYEPLGVSSRPIVLGPVKGSMDKRIASITTSVNSHIYRKYVLSYDTSSDLGHATSVAGGVNVAMAGGNFWQGAAGMAGGVSSTGFLAGAVAGASAGLAGGLVSGVGNSLVEGNCLGKSLLDGLTSGGFGALSGGVTGGLAAGADALDMGTSYWTGKAELDLDGAYSCTERFKDAINNLKNNMGSIKGRYVGKYEGQNVYETRLLGSLDNRDFDGFTLPDRGICVGSGVFSKQKAEGLAMMQHEFGHVLQYRKVGQWSYYKVIAKESLQNCISDKIHHTSTHDTFWTETWANYLSKAYFGVKWLGKEIYK